MSEPMLAYTIAGQSPWATRVFADGRVEALSDLDVRFTEAGGFETRPQEAVWRPRAALAPDEVTQLEELIRDSAFFELPSELGEPGRVSDGSSTTWTVTIGGLHHSVRAYGARNAAHPVLEGLRRGFELLVGRAITRAAAEQTP